MHNIFVYCIANVCFVSSGGTFTADLIVNKYYKWCLCIMLELFLLKSYL
jgi:hypothetical protein